MVQPAATMSDSDDDSAGPVRSTGGRNYSATPAAPLDPWEAARQEKRTIYVGTSSRAVPANHAVRARAHAQPAVSGWEARRRPGGLDETITEQLLHAAFVPFGDILQVQIPEDPAKRAWLAQERNCWTPRWPPS